MAYAFSPIDLNPDFIPTIGYLDEIILLPFLLALAIKLIPSNIYLESQIHAQEWINQKQKQPKSKFGIIYYLVYLECS